MRLRVLVLLLFAGCLILVGRSIAGTAASRHHLAGTAVPEAYLPAELYNFAQAPSITPGPLDPTLTPMPTGTGTPTTPPTSTTTATPTVTPTPEITPSVGIVGSVFLKPRWASYRTPPIAYQILLDVSRPMSYDFNGHGTIGGDIAIGQDTVGGTDYHCHLVSISDPLPYSSDCGPWRHVAERRLYVAKQALARLIDQLDTQDMMRIIVFSSTLPGGASALGGWSSDKATLQQAVLSAGAYNGDPYRTDGWASAAQALEMAGQIWANGTPINAPNGQPYGRVTIYITSSTPAVFLDGQINYAQDVCPQYQGDLRALDDEQCQYDKQGYPISPHGQRPISAMVYQAAQVKNVNPTLQLFTLALAQSNPLGLAEVASSPSMLFLAPRADVMAQALDQIQSQVASVASECTESSTNTWIGTIDAAHRADSPPMPPLPAGVYGYVYLTDNLGQPVSVPWSGPGPDPRGSATNMIPVVADPGGHMGYSVPASAGLAAGTYHLTAYLLYKAADAAPTSGGDGQSRQYSRLMQDGLPISNVTFDFLPSEVLGLWVVPDPLRLDLNLNVNLCG